MGNETTRREELLVVAARLFSRKGYHATSMQDIADELNILRGSLYHYIESKEGLLYELMELGIQTLMERVRPIVESDLPPDEKLARLIQQHTVTIASYPDFMAVFLHELKSLSPPRRERILAYRQEYDHLVRRILVEGVECGVFRPVDVRVVSFALLGMVNWVYQWYSPDGPRSAEEIGAIFANVVLQGVLERPEK
ncbi:MAG: TetR/AcrR family transcriptional regulator [Ardenticatenia bacterium]|nr:TetR/AcrR family transcriptional regulator [Ardenticatenia bacterium]